MFEENELDRCLMGIIKSCLRYCYALEDVTILLRATASEETDTESEDGKTPFNKKKMRADWGRKVVLDALRWLPRKCKLTFVGATSEWIETALEKHEQYRHSLDNVGLHHLLQNCSSENQETRIR